MYNIEFSSIELQKKREANITNIQVIINVPEENYNEIKWEEGINESFV